MNNSSGPQDLSRAQAIKKNDAVDFGKPKYVIGARVAKRTSKKGIDRTISSINLK